MRRSCKAHIFCADGVYTVAHSFSKNFARGKSAPTEFAVLSAISQMGHGVSYAPYAPRYRFPQAFGGLTTGTVTLLCSPGGVPVDDVLGRGCDVAVADLTLVVGGPKGFAPYTPDEVLGFANASIARSMVSIGTEMQFASAIIAYMRVRLEELRAFALDRRFVGIRHSEQAGILYSAISRLVGKGLPLATDRAYLRPLRVLIHVALSFFEPSSQQEAMPPNGMPPFPELS